MADHFSYRFVTHCARHRQAVVNMVLQNLKGAVPYARFFHRRGDFRDLPFSAKAAFFSLLHVILGIEHRLLDPFVGLNLGKVFAELSDDSLIVAGTQPIRMLVEILLENAKQTRTFPLSHSGLLSGL